MRILYSITGSVYYTDELEAGMLIHMKTGKGCALRDKKEADFYIGTEGLEGLIKQLGRMKDDLVEKNNKKEK